jgi:hypothetical protein
MTGPKYQNILMASIGKYGDRATVRPQNSEKVYPNAIEY